MSGTDTSQLFGSEFLNHYCDAWDAALNSRSTERMLDLVTEDIYWDDTVFWPHPIRGHDELRVYMDTVFKTMPNYEFYEIDRFFSRDASRAVILWGQRGSGPKSINPDATFDFQGCDVLLDFCGGKLSHYQAAYEINDMCRQLGLIPERNGDLGAAYLRGLARNAR